MWYFVQSLFCLPMKTCTPCFLMFTRSVWKVSSNFEYYKKLINGATVTLQLIRSNIFMHTQTAAEYWTIHSAARWCWVNMLSVTIIFTITTWLDQQICVNLQLNHSSMQTVTMIKTTFRHNSMSESHIKLWYQRWSGIWGKWSTFWKAFNKQNTWKYLAHACCHQWKSVNNSERIRRSEDSADLFFRALTEDLGMKCVTEKLVPWLLS